MVEGEKDENEGNCGDFMACRLNQLGGDLFDAGQAGPMMRPP